MDNFYTLCYTRFNYTRRGRSGRGQTWFMLFDLCEQKRILCVVTRNLHERLDVGFVLWFRVPYTVLRAGELTKDSRSRNWHAGTHFTPYT